MLNENFIEREEYEEQLNNRWGWLTEDIEDADERLNTQLVLESSYKVMIQENLLPKGYLEEAVLTEDMLTEAPQMSGSVGDYVIPKVMFPMIRRVYPELIANKLVSVQPIQTPTGVVYYIHFDYSNTKGTIKAGDEYSGNIQQTNPAYATWYSSEKIGPFTATAAAGEVVDFGAQEGITEFLGTDPKEYRIKRFEVYNKTTGKAIATVYGGTHDNVTFDATTGQIQVTVPEAAFADGDNEFQAFLVYDQEGTKKIPEMEFGIDHMNVTVKERKMKARWTKEAEQDMQAYHKIDVEQELIKVIGSQTNYEIDREILTFIDDHIIPELSFSHDWTDDAATTGNNTQGNYLDRHRCLAQKLYAAGTKVATFNRLAPCDWAVCSPKVACTLQMLPDWKAGEISNHKSTFYNAGTLGNGTMTFYVDPNRTGAMEDEITEGFKSKDSTYGAGVVYSPYANWMSSTVVNPENFNNVRGTFTRYGLTLCPRGQYNYATIRIDNLAI
jgi:hypothetical protein